MNFLTSKIGTKKYKPTERLKPREIASMHAPIYVYLKTNKMKPGSKK